MNLFDFVERYSKICPEKIAISCEASGKTYNYSAFFAALVEETKTLKNYGVRGKVVVKGSYSIDTVVQVVSLLNMGCVVIPIERLDKESDFKISRLMPDFILDEGEYIDGGFKTRARSVAKSAKDGQLVIYTSGSTNEPKAILHKEASFLFGISEKRKPSSFTHVAALGFDHIGGINNWIKCVAKGSTLILPKNFTSSNILHLIVEQKPEVIASTPTFFKYLIDHTSAQLKFVKIVSYGAERMEGSLLEKLEFLCPKARFIQTYGTTETGILPIHGQGSVFNFSNKNIDYKIENGQLFIKSETAAVKNLSTDSSFENWISTGDFAEELEGGKVRLLGRSEDFISVGGEKVNSRQIEFYVNQCDGVVASKAFGLKNDILGQVVGVKVQLLHNFKGNENSVKNAIRKICSENLSRFKVPVKIEFTAIERKSAHRLKSS